MNDLKGSRGKTAVVLTALLWLPSKKKKKSNEREQNELTDSRKLAVVGATTLELKPHEIKHYFKAHPSFFTCTSLKALKGH